MKRSTISRSCLPARIWICWKTSTSTSGSMRTRSRTASSWRVWALLLLAPLASLAAQGQEPAQKEAEQDWVQFLDEDESAPQRGAVEEPEEIEDPNDVVS